MDVSVFPIRRNISNSRFELQCLALTIRMDMVHRQSVQGKYVSVLVLSACDSFLPICEDIVSLLSSRLLLVHHYDLIHNHYTKWLY
jgi:hypothetical protein